MRARGGMLGTAAHRFGRAVTNPDTDLRLASFALNTIDYEAGMVFDAWITNNPIYPYSGLFNLTATASYAVVCSRVTSGSLATRQQAQVPARTVRTTASRPW